MPGHALATNAATDGAVVMGEDLPHSPDPRAWALLAAMLTARRGCLALLQADMTTACEQAALAAGATADRDRWNRRTWRRYLDEASRFASNHGPAIRRLQADIARLQRLADLGVRF